MSREKSKAIVRRYRLRYVGKGNLTLADEILPDEFVLNGERIGRERHKQMVMLLHSGFPDLSFTIDDMITEGEKVVERVTFRGIHSGEFLGISPTGRQVEAIGMLVHRVVDGKIVEIWEVIDMIGLLEQLGVALPMGAVED